MQVLCTVDFYTTEILKSSGLETLGSNTVLSRMLRTVLESLVLRNPPEHKAANRQIQLFRWA
jgi:hypothetical protein